VRRRSQSASVPLQIREGLRYTSIVGSANMKWHVHARAAHRLHDRKRTMTQPRRIADRHRRTRRDHATETAEDYVEAIAEIIDQTGTCRVVDLTRRFDVTHVTVTRIVRRLQKEGYVETEPYRPIQLTGAGRRLARASHRRHEVVYRFLLSIGVPDQVAAIDAEGIEHHVSPVTLKCFKQMTQRLCLSGVGGSGRGSGVVNQS
jgi:DtxR family transcriptional regulator, manganese transport regulator